MGFAGGHPEGCPHGPWVLREAPEQALQGLLGHRLLPFPLQVPIPQESSGVGDSSQSRGLGDLWIKHAEGNCPQCRRCRSYRFQSKRVEIPHICSVQREEERGQRPRGRGLAQAQRELAGSEMDVARRPLAKSEVVGCKSRV